MFFENVRRPGARCFLRSSAVGHDGAVTWDVGEMLLSLISRYADGARKFCVGFTPRFRIPRIDEEYVFVTIETRAYLINSDSLSHVRTSQVVQTLAGVRHGNVAGELRM
jgi:hypothetical protein